MKKNNIRIIAAAAGILSLAGCSNDGGGSDAGSITIDASIGRATKVSYNGNAAQFSAGDRIAVYGWMGSSTEVPAKLVVNGVRNTLGTDGKWTPATQMLWKTVTDAHYFLGVYPAKDITDFTADPYTLDPSADGDLLVATNLSGVKATGGAVLLNFDHVMAKLNVNLKFRSEWEQTPTVTSVTATAQTAATVNYLAKEVTANGAATQVALTEMDSPAAGFGRSFSGLQVPQAIRTITVTIGGKEYAYQSSDDIILTGGHYTTVNLNVGRDKLELSTISITGWDTESLPDNETVPFELDNNGHEYVNMGLSVMWGTCNIGATAQDEYGDYYAWGETETYYESLDPLTWRAGKTGYYWDGYSMCTEYLNVEFKKFNRYSSANGNYWYDYPMTPADGKTELKDYDYEDDVARYELDGGWRIPSPAEWEELINTDNSTWDWKTTADGYAHPGYLVTSKITGNSIFLPAAGAYLFTDNVPIDYEGNYWSGSIDKYIPYSAHHLHFHNGNVEMQRRDRIYGLSVRPVCPRIP